MPKTAVVRINDEIKDILSRGTFDGVKYKLPEQLDRSTYNEANKILKAVGAEWARGAKAHIFPSEVAVNDFQKAIGVGELIDRKKTYGQFDTPKMLARELVKMACLSSGQRILEPSAGIGRICDAIAETGKDVYVEMIEIDPDRHEVLCDKYIGNWLAFNDDFLNFDPGYVYDRIIANPPFGNSEDAKHVMHMLDLLARGGCLVTVMATSIQFRDNGAYAKLKNRLDAGFDYQILNLPMNMFKESGTGVNTCVLIAEHKTSEISEN